MVRKPREVYGKTWWCRNGVCRVDGRRYSYIFDPDVMKLQRLDRVTGLWVVMRVSKQPLPTKGAPLLTVLATRFCDKRRREEGRK